MIKKVLSVFAALLVASPFVAMADEYTDGELTWVYTDMADGTVRIDGLTCSDPSLLSSTDAVMPDAINGNPVTEIANMAMTNSFVTSLQVADTVISIGDNAFAGSSLTNVVLSSELTAVPMELFKGCTNLVSVTLGDKVEIIGESAFDTCKALRWIKLPDNLLNIGAAAFRNSGLRTVIIPQTVEGMAIGQHSFSGCKSLNEIWIAASRINDYDYTSLSTGNDADILLYDEYANGIGWCFVENADGASVTIFKQDRAAIASGVSGEVKIPSTLGSLPVTGIGFGAFRALMDATSYVIPDGVVSISDYAFSGNESLSSVDIPASVEEVGTYAFNGCVALNNVVLPDNVEEIEEGLFKSCTNLTQLAFSANLKSIGESAFERCGMLEGFVMPNSVTSLGDSAFASCTNMSSVVLSTSLEGIGSGTFAYCTKLADIDIPGSVKVVGEKAFYNCHLLSSLNAADGLEEIGNDAFGSCTNLTAVTLPESLRKIGNSAFKYNTALKSFVIPEGVVKVGAFCFAYSSELEYVDLPSTLTEIGENAFVGTKIKTMTFPDGTTVVPEGIFMGMTSLTTVDIADTVTVIGENSFRNCESLESIELPDNVSIIGNRAFEGCKKLTTVTLPPTVSVVGEGVFVNCVSLEEILVWEEAPFDAEAAFLKNNLANPAVKLRYYSEIVDGIAVTVADNGDGSASFRYTHDTVTPAISTSTEGAYVVPEEVNGAAITEIGEYAFRDCDELTSVVIPSTVTNIANNAFGGNTAIEEVVVPDAIYDDPEALAALEEQLPEGTVIRKLSDVVEGFGEELSGGADLEWDDSNDNRWIKDDEETAANNGALVVRSATNLLDNASSWIEMTAQGAGTLTFEWKVSSLAGDGLNFIVDGNDIGNLISGDTDWVAVSVDLTTVEEHTFRWDYRKDAQDSAGDDCGYLRNVVWTPNADANKITLTVKNPKGPGTADDVLEYAFGDEVTIAPTATDAEDIRYAAKGWCNGSGDLASIGDKSSVTFTLTKDSTIEWIWEETYRVIATAGEGGKISSGDGAKATEVVCWVADGGTISFIAYADDVEDEDNAKVFDKWDGDITDSAFSGNVITITNVTSPRSITALFASIWCEFTVNSGDAAVYNDAYYGTPQKFTSGVTERIQKGTTYKDIVIKPAKDIIETNYVDTASGVDTNRVCYTFGGWIGTGSVPTVGNDQYIESLQINTDSTLTILTQTNHYVTVASIGNGSLDFTEGWIVAGSNLTITASANVVWGGETNNATLIAERQITIPVTSALDITATFGAGEPPFAKDDKYTEQGTDISLTEEEANWLNEFVEAGTPKADIEDAIINGDGDGLSLKEEYLLNTDPTKDTESKLAITAIVVDGTNVTVTVALTRTENSSRVNTSINGVLYVEGSTDLVTYTQIGTATFDNTTFATSDSSTTTFDGGINKFFRAVIK